MILNLTKREVISLHATVESEWYSVMTMARETGLVEDIHWENDLASIILKLDYIMHDAEIDHEHLDTWEHRND